MRGALCLGPTDQPQQSLLHCSTQAADQSLIVPQHFLTSEEFLLQEIWFTREGTRPSHPHPPTTLHPPGNIYPWICLTLFPFTPLAISRLRLSLLELGVPGIIPPGSLTEGERRACSLFWPPDTPKLVWLVSGSRVAAEEGRREGLCVIRWKSSIRPLSPVGACLWSSWVSSTMLRRTSQTITL